MKRFLSILLVAVLIVTSMSVVAFAAGSANASVSKSQTVKPGDTVTLTVTVSGEFSNYELTMKAADGLTITSIDGVTANISNGKVAFSAATNNASHSFTVTVKVADDIAPGEYKVSANMTKAGMIVGVENDTEDGIADGLVHVSLGSGSATLTVACDHAWGEGVVTKEPTCTEKGVMTYTCSKCGTTKTEDIAALGHDWDAGVVTKEPTCTEKGVMTYTCSRCGTTKTEDIAKKDHDYKLIETVKATCTEDGYKLYKCSVCGHEKKETIPAADGHSYGEWTVTKAPTCTEAGEQIRTCSACGHVDTQAIDANGHVWAEETWCYDETHHWHVCSVCGVKCEHNAEHGPITEWQIVKEPTAKETGLQQKLCETCGAVVASEEIPANGQGTIDPVPGTGDPTMLIVGGLSGLLLLLAAAVLYINSKRKAAK